MDAFCLRLGYENREKMRQICLVHTDFCFGFLATLLPASFSLRFGFDFYAIYVGSVDHVQSWIIRMWKSAAYHDEHRIIDAIRYWKDKIEHGSAKLSALLVDGTLASPLGQRPFEHGAHVVMHSSTKYLSGHSDLLGGVLIVHPSLSDVLTEKLFAERIMDGAVMGNLEAWLLLWHSSKWKITDLTGSVVSNGASSVILMPNTNDAKHCARNSSNNRPKTLPKYPIG